MAIDFARSTYHSRGKGHSAVKGAAYRSASRLYDERTGEFHNFTQKGGVVETFIFLPNGADKKFLDREYLWNEVEKAEKRVDAQVARDIVIALPRELGLAQHKELAIRFADEHFVSKGLVVDVALHYKENNPHAHITCTTRRLIGNKFSEKKPETSILKCGFPAKQIMLMYLFGTS